jgi:ATP-binding cassette, subfamily B, bacterial IrtA/YbtP
VGIFLYMKELLTVSEFAICIILFLGIVAPLPKFTLFVNNIKAIEYAVKAAGRFLNLDERQSASQKVRLASYDITFRDVDFSSGEKDRNNVLNTIRLEIDEGSVASPVGPSDGEKQRIAIARAMLENAPISL